MGNSISNIENNEFLNMSNGSTSVLIELLVLAGSDLSKNLWEKELMVWLAENDQTFRGLGCVGFDISELGWTKENFENEKKFLLKVVDFSLNKTNWQKLNYEPHEGIAFDILNRLKNMIQNYHFNTNNLNSIREWYSKPKESSNFEKCLKHQVFLHYLTDEEDKRCIVCNNAAIE